MKEPLAGGMHKKPKRRIRAFIQLGVSRSWAIRYGYSRMSGLAIAYSPIMGTTITEARLRKKGYIPFLEYFHQIRKDLKKMIELFYEPSYTWSAWFILSNIEGYWWYFGKLSRAVRGLR